ncbi:MAG: prephenate dehydratase [Bacillota bacterium]|nr:prephenate dehydratase [Bacillota bacterium]
MCNADSDKRLRIGYFGVPGSYTHEAMLNIFGEGCDEVFSESFEDIFRLLMKEEIKYGVLPIENSSTGGISDVMDLLNKYNAYIIGEKCLRINHCLLGIPGTELEDIKEVYSHPQPLQQCKEFLESQKGWQLYNYYNSAKSVEYVRQCGSKAKAAVGSLRAAKLYGLEVIKDNINTNEHNYTRFVIISRELEVDDYADKISVVLTLPHILGSLYNVIKIIYENNLNMMKIESRPIMGKPWEYSFYIDFEGSLKDEKVKAGLGNIQSKCTEFKVLGNYKKDA